MHDSRIGRFFAVDPLAKRYAFYSPYAFSGNRVIDAVELEGLEPKPVNDVEDKDKPTVVKEGAFVFTRFNAVWRVYHEGGTFTESGWYTVHDYSFLTERMWQSPWVEQRLWSVANYNKYLLIGGGAWDEMYNIATSASVFSKNAKIAGEDAATMEQQGGHGTRENAYRHATLSAMITYHFGAEVAEGAMNSHEERPNKYLLLQDQDPSTLRFDNLRDADEYVDLVNNYLGRQMVDGTWTDGIKRDEMALLVLDYFRQNGLWVTAKSADGTGYKVWKHKITDEEYYRAVENIREGNEWGFNAADGDRYTESNESTLKLGKHKPN